MNRIGYLVPEFPSQTHAFFWREISSLRSLGLTVRLLSTKRPAADSCRHPFADEARAQTHYSFPPSWTAALGTLLSRPMGLARCIAYLLSLKETPWAQRARLVGLLLVAADVAAFARREGLEHLHVHSCADAAHLAALTRLLGGPRYSLTLHGDLPVYGVDHAAKMRHAAFVSCVTRPLQQQVREQAGLPVSRCPVLWMGIDTARFGDQGERRCVPNQLHLLTVARLNYLKGHHHALVALQRLVASGVDARYTIVGEGPHRAEIEADILQMGLQDRVRMTGSLGEDEVLKVLQGADVLVLPSFGLGEAAPVAVMEAMACSLPVVCSIIGGTADMIHDGLDGFLVPQKDEDALFDRLQRLAGDVSLRQRIGEAARRKAVTAFDSAALGRRLLALMTDAPPTRDDALVEQPAPPAGAGTGQGGTAA
jgi:glycosyltransferase involved in cell wall biosynthesis